MSDIITTYEPDNSVRQGFRSIFKDMAKEVRDGKWLTWQLFKRDFKAAYQQSVLGIFWKIIPPIVTVATFFLLNQAGVLDVGDIGVPYAVYAFLGLAFWGLFSSGVTTGCTALTGAGNLIAKINFPREVLVFSSIGKSIVSFMIQMIVVSGFMIWYYFERGFAPHWLAIVAPFMIIPIILLVLGLSFILSLFNVVIRDISGGVGMIMTFLLFLTPILYKTPQTGWLAMLTDYNPIYYLVAVPRDLILFGYTNDWFMYGLSVLLAVAAFFIFWLIFHLTEKRVSERI